MTENQEEILEQFENELIALAQYNEQEAARYAIGSVGRRKHRTTAATYRKIAAKFRLAFLKVSSSG